MKKQCGWLLTGVALAGVAGLLLAGCETTKSADDSIVVSPNYQLLTTNIGEIVTFTASVASTNSVPALPLEWTVSDGSLGVIQSSSGVNAFYQSSGKAGVNTVTVRDQANAHGLAVVEHR